LKIKVINHSTTIFKHDLSFLKKATQKIYNESEKQKTCKRKATRKKDGPSFKFKMWQWLLRVADVRAI
jgi:hypothetical protein